MANILPSPFFISKNYARHTESYQQLPKYSCYSSKDNTMDRTAFSEMLFFFIGMVVLSPSAVLDLPVNKFKTMHYRFPSHFLTTRDNNIG